MDELANRSKAILATIPDIIMEVNVNKVCTWANKAGLEFFGEDIVGRETSFYFEDDDNINYIESWQKRKDGESRLLASWSRTIKDVNGNVTGAISIARDITESRRAGEEISGLAKFPSENPHPILRAAKDSTILYANEASSTLLNILGCQVGQLLPDEWREFISEVLRSGFSKEIEVECGENILLMTFAPVIDSGYVNVYGLDITRRKRAEKALLESESKWRSITENSPDRIMLLDRDANILFINHTIPGLSREQVIGTSFYDYALPECRKIIEECFKQVLKTGKADKFESIYKYADGRIQYFESYGGPVMKAGKAVGLTVSSRDITDRKRAEEALRASHSFLRIANFHTEMMPMLKEFLAEAKNFSRCEAIGIRILDEEGNIPYSVYKGFSQEFYELESPLSIKSDHCMCINIIKGTTDPKLPFYTEGGSFYMNGTTRFLATVSEQEKGKTRNICNEFGYESVALIPIRLKDRMLGLIHLADSQDNMVPLETVQVLENATMKLSVAIQRVLVEEELRKAHDDLEFRVKKRTEELVRAGEILRAEMAERQKTEEARKIAERKLAEQRTLSMRSDRLRSLGEMAAAIAHELNQPLVGVRGLAEHLLIGMSRGWELTEEKLRDRIALIVEQADRMSSIIEHVRLFAREAGKDEMHVVEVNDVVRSAMKMLKAQFQSRGFILECDLCEDQCTILANPFSLEEVLLNLIINARDAVEERLNIDSESISPRVKLRTILKGRGRRKQVKIEVIDQGIGIKKEHLPNVFDPFFSTKEPDKGTGLGLAISKTIVEQLNGTIDIKSTVGKGTTVTIFLPIVDNQEKR